MVNGSPHGFFGSSRGLLQGDPLSSLLFVIVMEALSRMMNEVVGRDAIKGFEVGRDGSHGVGISHLLFADDTLIFCGEEELQMRNLRCLLLCFEAVSGLRINLGKSEVIPIGRVIDVQGMAEILGCRVSSIPMTYLGLPLGAKFKCVSIWDGIVERFARRLAGWKRIYLSKGGRLTLIRSTLASLPTYFLSLFPIPLSVAKRLEKLQRDFLWGSGGDEHRFHLVKWARVCSPVRVGGLGLKRLPLFNRALLGKWLWRFSYESESLWQLVIKAKYGCAEGGWSSLAARGSYGVSLWKFISQGWTFFRDHIRFAVGRGSRIRFWHDKWCGESSLCMEFPHLFSLARHKDAWVADCMAMDTGEVVWDVQFERLFNDWEMEMFSAFGSLLYSWSRRRGGEDKMLWMGSKTGVFSVKTMYALLLEGSIEVFPWRQCWRSMVPPRVAFFVWEVIHRKILTIDNLRRRGVCVTEWCYLCKCDGETVDHLLLHCSMARGLWGHVLRILNYDWVMPRKVVDVLHSWKRPFGDPIALTIWKMIPACIWWSLWRERNGRCFEDRAVSLSSLGGSMLHVLFLWANSVLGYPFMGFLDFLSYLACLL